MPYVDRLKAIKSEKKLTLEDIAQLSGVPESTVTRVFNGKTSSPTIDTFFPIAIAMGASLDELAGLRQPDATPIDSQIESTLISYSELLRERDERLKEKDELIASLKEAYSKELKFRKKILFAVGTVMSLLLIVVILLIMLDISLGHVGYIRY